MKSRKYFAIAMLALLALPVWSEVVYTPVNVVLNASGSYPIDLNHDGITDFTLFSNYLITWCQNGDGNYWYLDLIPNQNNAVLVSSGTEAAALNAGTLVGFGLASQTFYLYPALMASFSWGQCGNFSQGNWFNVPDHYLGLQFRARQPDGTMATFFGWARVSNSTYLDQFYQIHVTTHLSGFAYESTPGKPIITGRTSE